ncbi:MAG: dTMP kinase [Finegoldia magna]|uniref:Thymidylate kinase n=2 Tax=Finegoldia magna TaxID=1260 RepID=A0A233W7G5_FINMA|nr:dTMP kinase [Finegoldia magna]EFK94444.1 dTMP kinase [Finegoldia magna ACS-171-V-Col3]EFL54141.1 dTMP kinase [Finegoldia magna BVS033A4]EGS34719.1 dTMP kinase [Finegoldia magna SY403409CC001050417]MBS6927841.1 dTMP kinase [Finegoldia magna]OXZ37192.1 thymidylate kinase [Finegoldia magna]
MFITFEGPDGSGKSTIIQKVYDYLIENNYDVIKTREPGGSPIAEKIRNLILDTENIKMGYRTEALLYAASRAQHVEETILPALNENKIVLCDRFLISSLAYQGVGRGLGIENVRNINEFAINGIFPDFVLFFDVDPITTLKRKSSLDTADRLEKEGNNFHERVYNGYKEILNSEKNIEIIDATQSVEDVFSQCIEVLKRRNVL